MAFTVSQAAFLLKEDATLDDVYTAGDAIVSLGGTVALAAPGLTIGTIDPAVQKNLIGKSGVVRVTGGVIPESVQRGRTRVDQVNFRILRDDFNALKSGKLAAQFDSVVDKPREPIFGDFAHIPDDLPPSQAPLRGRLRATSNSAHANWTTSMKGYTYAQLFFVDSIGGAFSWTDSQINNVLNPLLFALGFWSNQATAKNASASFIVGAVLPYNESARISMEPAQPASTHDDWEWVNQVLVDCNTTTNPYDDAIKQPGGFGATTYTGTGVAEAVHRYNQFVAQSVGARWAFTAFIVANVGTDGYLYLNGSQPVLAYNYTMGGPYCGMSYVNGNLGPGLVDEVFAHEVGHIFWACDEYAPQCTSCNYCWNEGPALNTDNANCAYNRTLPLCYSSGQFCKMWSVQHTDVCWSTAGQVGWGNPYRTPQIPARP